MSGPYDDIIDLPRHISSARPQMSASGRAAQFSPFAALTGFEAAIKETARLTDERKELDETAAAVLEMKLNMLADIVEDRPEAVLTYYRQDSAKKGGAYVTAAGTVKKIDEFERAIVFDSGEKIKISDIFEIECESFGSLY